MQAWQDYFAASAGFGVKICYLKVKAKASLVVLTAKT